jgi:hypothetical protein
VPEVLNSPLFSLFDPSPLDDIAGFSLISFNSNILFVLDRIINGSNFQSSFQTSVPFTTLLNWNHIALVRDGSTSFKIFINGVNSIASNTTLSTFQIGPNSNGRLNIGASSNPSFSQFPGLMTNFKFTPGEVLYTNNFTPSSTPLSPSSPYTDLLLLATNSANLLTDSSGYNRFIANSGTTWSSDTPF